MLLFSCFVKPRRGSRGVVRWRWNLRRSNLVLVLLQLLAKSFQLTVRIGEVALFAEVATHALNLLLNQLLLHLEMHVLVFTPQHVELLHPNVGLSQTHFCLDQIEEEFLVPHLILEILESQLFNQYVGISLSHNRIILVVIRFGGAFGVVLLCYFFLRFWR